MVITCGIVHDSTRSLQILTNAPPNSVLYFHTVLRDVVLENITGTAAEQVAHVLGLPGAPVGNVVIRNSSFSGVKKRSVVNYVDRLTLENVRVNGMTAKSL